MNGTEDSNDRVYHVTAGQTCGKAVVRAEIYVNNDSGEELVGFAEHEIEVQDAYHQVTVEYGGSVADKLPVLEFGDTVMVTPTLWLYQKDQNDRTAVTENVRYYWEYWDTGALEITDSKGKTLTPEDNTGVAPFTLKKINREYTDIQLAAVKAAEDGGEEEAARTTLRFHEADYSVWFKQTEGEVWDLILYEGETASFEAAGADFSSLSADLCWSVGYYEEEGFTAFEGDPKNYGVTIEGTEVTLDASAMLADGSPIFDIRDFVIRAEAAIGDEVFEETGAEIWIHAREPFYDYQFEYYGMNLLPRWSNYIGNTFNCYVEDANHREGADVEVSVTSVKLVLDEDCADDAIVLEPTEDGGWEVVANDYGHAVVTMQYKLNEDGYETDTYTFDVWVNEDVWQMELSSSTGIDKMLPGKSIDLTAAVWHEYQSGEYEYFREDAADDLIFEWWCDDEDYESVVTFDKNNSGKTLTLTGQRNEEERWVQIQVRAYEKDENGEIAVDEDGNLIEFAYAAFNVTVENEYYQIFFADAKSSYELEPGETVNLMPELWYVTQDNPDGEQVSVDSGSLRYGWSWDPGAIEITADSSVLDPENPYGTGTFSLKKLENWRTDAYVYAELQNENEGEPYWEEVAGLGFRFEEIDYSASIEGVRGDGHTWFYSDEDEYTLTLSSENQDIISSDTENRKCKIDWSVGIWKEDDSWEPLFDADTDAFSVNADGLSITFDGRKMAEYAQQLTEAGKNPYEGFSVRLDLSVNDYEVNNQEIGIQLRDSVFDPEDSSVVSMLPEMYFIYENDAMVCYVEDAEHPYGENIEVEIQNISVGKTGDDAVFEVSHDVEEKTWLVTAKQPGDDTITFNVSYTVGEETRQKTVGRDVVVANDIYLYDVSSSTGVWNLLPGGTLQILKEVQHGTYSGGERSWELLEPEKYTVTYEWDENLIDISGDGTVTAHDETDVEAGFSLEIAVDGAEDAVIAPYYNSIYITDIYYTLSAQSVVAEPGETVTAIDLQPELLRISTDAPEGERVEADFKVESLDGSEPVAWTEDGAGFTVQLDEITQEDDPVGFWVKVTAEAMQGDVYEETDAEITVCRHVWERQSESVEPTCTKAGTYVDFCEKCQSRKTQTAAPTGHSAGAWTVTKEASCTSEGKRVRKCTVCQATVSEETIARTAHTEGAWTVEQTAGCTTPGRQVQKCTVCGTTLKEQTVPASGHSFGAWQKTSDATVFAAESLSRQCTVCGASESRSSGGKLAATITVPASSIPMKTKQKTKVFRVSGLAEGDYVTSWKSSNTKIVKVTGKADGTCTLKAQKTTGNATLTITLASGLVKTVKVKVQKPTVVTKSVKLSAKKITLKKGEKYTLTAALKPITSTDKVKYTTSNKSVVKVTSKGIITASKPGTAKITVQAGKKKATCTVKVTG